MKQVINIFFSNKIGDQNIPAREFLAILFEKFSKLKYTNEWQEGGLFDQLDTRPQVFLRIESATLILDQNIFATDKLYQEFCANGLKVGYGQKFIERHVYMMREVGLRTAFLDAIFYSIDYLVYELNQAHGLETASRDKQKAFNALLSHLKLQDHGLKKTVLIKEIAELLPGSMKAVSYVFKEANDSLVTYTKIHEYLTLIRNSLHNNGFSNKDMPNLKVGPFVFENIKSNEYLQCLGISNHVFIVFCMLHVLESICEVSVAMHPKLIADPHLCYLQNKLGYIP